MKTTAEIIADLEKRVDELLDRDAYFSREPQHIFTQATRLPVQVELTDKKNLIVLLRAMEEIDHADTHEGFMSRLDMVEAVKSCIATVTASYSRP